ncbi:MAG: cell division protein ZapA [Synergistaceae bacterium]|nr:cell division protein ZapA [Synergistaceae bacterium]
MAELREVTILIGARSYRMQTALDDVTLNRVISIISEVSEPVGNMVNQDQLLMLTCLQLAYSLEKISRRLENLTDKVKEMEKMSEAREQSEQQ